MTAASPARSRPRFAAFILLVVVAGLTSRSSLASSLPSFITTYAGDTLWALMVYLGFGFFFPTHSPRETALLAILFAFSIEFSQFYHAAWIDNLRQTRLGGLILGFGFRPSDLVCYSVGVVLGYLAERFLRCPRTP